MSAGGFSKGPQQHGDPLFPPLSREVLKTLHSVKVDGIGLNVSQAKLNELFSRYGEVMDIYIPKDNRPGLGTGYCFVRYPDIRMAEAALELDNRITLPGCTAPFHCSLAGRRQMYESHNHRMSAGSSEYPSYATPGGSMDSRRSSWNESRTVPYPSRGWEQWESAPRGVITDARQPSREAPAPSELPATPGFERYMIDNFQQRPLNRENYFYDRYSHYRPREMMPMSAKSSMPAVGRKVGFDDRTPRQPYSGRLAEVGSVDNQRAPLADAYYGRYSHYRPGPKSFEKYMGDAVRV
ncbi:splicing factor,putative [Perkinsus marinus ATCC 50983]|uniref:Splicing factor,putative n=1 Tax=Perkinsus marinus (strain ATCC 50983 / TXsc) TaxID=423536 RepID=C5LFP9_PERM5|nr:splicing factor,putative [Perkinsus marinus ATCC 50983]EER04444.1 splicing factor,putative [Perkinsus marinus ATCC 50983]|eukprot:XP_002772628.1 splicing factor,putative [Perkinsus marinus ATCC 50983]